MLITFEGIDGSGKTTQVKLLANWLRKKGLKVITTEEPTNNIIGREVKKLMKKESYSWIEAILFAADRALHCNNVIIPNNNKIVICDRYIHSTLAYQTAMGLSKKWIKCLNQNAPEPDLTFYLDIKPETAMNRVKRRNKRLIKYERIELLNKVRKNYLEMISKKFKLINGEKSIKEVHKLIIKEVDKLDFMR